MTSQAFTPYSIQRVRHSLAHFAIGKALGVLLGLGLLLVLVRILSVKDYAFYVATLALLEVITQFSSFGLYVAVQRYLPEYLYKGEGRRLRRMASLLCAGRAATLGLAVIVVYPLASFVASALGLEGFVDYFRLFLLVILLEGFARFLEVIFDSLLLQKMSQASLLLRAAIRLGALALILQDGERTLPLEIWIYIDASAAFAGCLLGGYRLWHFLRYMAHAQPGTGTDLELPRYLRYCGPTFLAASLYTASGPNVVILIAARILPTAQFGAFGFAMAFGAALQRYLPMFLLINLIRPLFVAARQRADYPHRLPALAGLVFKLNAFVLAPAIAFLAVAGEPVAQIITGGRFPEAGKYLLALALLFVAQSLRGVASLTAQAMENSRAPLLGTTLGLLGLALGVILGQWLEAYGLVIGLILSELLFALSVITALRHEGFVVLPAWAQYGRLFACAALSGAVVWTLQLLGGELSPIKLCLYAASAIALHLFFCFLFKPFTLEERTLLNRTLRRRIFVW